MYIKNKILSILYKLIIIIAGLVGILIQMGMLEGRLSLSPFRYFTLLSNLACVIYFILAVASLLSKFNDKEYTTYCPTFKGIIMMCITVTLLVAHFMLNGIARVGSMAFSVNLLHYVVPIMAILDWILFDRKGQIKKYSPVIWLVMPLVYLLYAMIAAHIGNGIGIGSRYPYPFLDIDKLGSKVVSDTVAIMIGGFLLLGYALYLVDYLLSKLHKKIK